MVNVMKIERHTPGRVSRGTKLGRVAWNVAAAVLFRPFVTPVFSIYKNVSPWAVVGGNPAKKIKMRKEINEERRAA